MIIGCLVRLGDWNIEEALYLFYKSFTVYLAINFLFLLFLYRILLRHCIKMFISLVNKRVRVIFKSVKRFLGVIYNLNIITAKQMLIPRILLHFNLR
jgi:hypothetical protein